MKYLLLPVGFALLGVSLALAATARNPERDALACARASDGTDQAIVDCYTTRGLPIPDDV